MADVPLLPESGGVSRIEQGATTALNKDFQPHHYFYTPTCTPTSFWLLLFYQKSTSGVKELKRKLEELSDMPICLSEI